MIRFIREHFVAIVVSVLFHGAIVALLIYGFLNYRESRKPTPAPQLAIEAEVVDEERINQEMRKIEEEEARKLREEQERAEQLKRERELEEQKLEEARKLREQEEEAQRQLAEQRKREEAEAEAKRKEQEEKAAAEKKRKEAEARRKAAQEARLKAEREAQLRRQLEEEERRNEAVASGMLQQYVAQLQARIQRAWIRPPTAKAGLRCVVYVTQVPGGQVTSARVGECNGDDIVRQSIEAAVYRASPLPEPADPALFERNLELIFAPQE